MIYFPAKPIKQLKYSIDDGRTDCYDEREIVQLENGKFTYIHRCGIHSNKETGMTEIIDFDTEEEAITFWKEEVEYERRQSTTKKKS